MTFTTKSTAFAAAALLGATTLAATSSYCPRNDINSGPCYSWGVPDASGNIYFQIKAPATYAWAGLGIGSSMSDADVFIIYTDGTGNVTLSPRIAVGETSPQQTTRNDLTLLAGSGVIDGQMVANVKCTKCPKIANLKGVNDWISAWNTGGALNSASVTQMIAYHTPGNHAAFQLDFSKAQISSDANPFVGGGETPVSNPGGNNGNNGNSIVEIAPTTSPMVYAHGIIMMILFTAMYPLGAVLMPLLGNWIIHACWQTVAIFAMWAAFGIGYVIANGAGQFFKSTHTQLGVFVCALLSIQPLLGWQHHQMYRKHQKRTGVSHAHIWYGRAVMILGVINGGLGLQLANTKGAMMYAYIVMAAIFWSIYIVTVVFKTLRPSQTKPKEVHEGSQVRHS